MRSTLRALFALSAMVVIEAFCGYVFWTCTSSVSPGEHRIRIELTPRETVVNLRPMLPPTAIGAIALGVLWMVAEWTSATRSRRRCRASESVLLSDPGPS
jgi:hypothetical protein